MTNNFIQFESLFRYIYSVVNKGFILRSILKLYDAFHSAEKYGKITRFVTSWI